MSSHAIRMTDAIDAAIPSTTPRMCPECRFRILQIPIPANTSPPPLLIYTVRSALSSITDRKSTMSCGQVSSLDHLSHSVDTMSPYMYRSTPAPTAASLISMYPTFSYFFFFLFLLVKFILVVFIVFVTPFPFPRLPPSLRFPALLLLDHQDQQAHPPAPPVLHLPFLPDTPPRHSSAGRMCR